MTKKSAELHKSVYIPSLQANSIYSHIYRNQPIYLKFTGMIPSSLEMQALMKLYGSNDDAFNLYTKENGKRTSRDIVSVKFDSKVRNFTDLKENLEIKVDNTEKQIKKLRSMNVSSKKDEKRIAKKIEKKEEYKKLLNQRIEILDESWSEVDIESLRNELYTNGFTLTVGKKCIDYVVYKRSTSKSRTGSVLFIKKSLRDRMINWSRMGIVFDNKEKVDYVSLLAYESLVGSSIKALIKIEPKNILVIDDIISEFEQDVNLITVDEKTELLKSKKGNEKIKQSLWDGQALLDESFFEGSDKSMFLLRNHMFKSAAFRCNVQEYLKKVAIDKGIDFDNWQRKDYFGNTVMLKDVRLITTPSSCKFLKFSKMLGSENDMWSHWRKVVESEGSLFGIVKEEKGTRLGTDKEGNPVQQLSYQFINSLPCTYPQLSKLATYEYDYIKSLKNDIEVFLDYAAKTADTTNGHEMLIDLYRHNPKIANTKLFRQWRSKTIMKYIDRVKMGKVKVTKSDYAVLLGNPMEMLASAAGIFDESKLALSGNQVYTKMFDFGLPMAGFRSPHTSPANVLSIVNTSSKDIDDYFPHLSKNIVIINSIKHPACEILSGADFDSDSCLISIDNTLVELAQYCKENYRVCVGDIEKDPKTYTVNDVNMSAIDNTLSKSQKLIGQVTNVAQLIMSNVWDAERNKRDCSKMWEKLECLTVLSGLCIDLAKRIPKLDIELQIKDARKVEGMLKYKPYWWNVRNKEVSKKGNQKNKEMKEEDIDKYMCPMDYLYRKFEKLPNAERIGKQVNINIDDLIIKREAGKATNSILNTMDDILEELADNIKHSHTKEITDDQKEENNRLRQELTDEAVEAIKKRKINENTMYAIIQRIIKNEADNNTIRLFSTIHRAKREEFLRAFSKK